MTTNKPEVISHMVISADKLPEKCRADDPHGFPVIRLSDYEALQAECDLWKNSAHGAHRQLTANRLETEKLAVYWDKAMAECDQLRKDADRYRFTREGKNHSFAIQHALRFLERDRLDSAIDAAMQELKPCSLSS